MKEIKRLENNHLYQVDLEPEVSPQDFLKTLVTTNINIDQFEIAAPTLDEIFIQVVTESGMKYE
jgi:ABC-type uncharacterized transport system ATPase subunit